MKLFIILVAALVAVEGTVNRVDLIDGIRIEYGRATTPLSERLVLRPYQGSTSVAALAAFIAPAVPTNDQLIYIEGLNTNNINLALAPPGVECITLANIPAVCTPQGTKGTPAGCSLPRQTNNAANTVSMFVVPAAVITQQSLRLADKICIQGDSRLTPTAGVGWADTELLYQVAIPCIFGNGGGLPGFTTAFDFTTPALPVFPNSCGAIAGLSLPTAVQDAVFRNIREDQIGDQIDWDLADRRTRTHCCGWRSSTAIDAANGNAVLPQKFGVCYNPNIQSCCSGAEDQRKQTTSVAQTNIAGTGKLVNKFTEKCCYGGLRTSATENTNPALRTGGIAPMIRMLDEPCPCITVAEYCNSYEGCCRATKYPEISAAITSANVLSPTTMFGSCYDPRRMGCCDTGAVFNSGTQQCCKISGVQNLDVPCPCSTNSHCDLNQACCKPFNPSAMETALEATSCNAYTNFVAGAVTIQQPGGSGVAVPDATRSAGFGQDTWGASSGINNRCLGQCLDTRFSICCNGNPCVGAYERCCNNTCCNKKTQSCVMGQRSALGSRFNDQNAGTFYELCTTVEALTPLRAVLAFFLPLALLFVTFSGLAFTLYFAKKQNALNPLSAYEKAMATLAFLVIFFAWPFYFSPLYKYAIITIWISFFSLLAATCGVKRLLPAALLLQVALLVYIFDPFGGNEILNLGYTRRGAALFTGTSADSGLFLSTMNLWKAKSCQPFFGGWFQRDPLVEDQARLDFAGQKTTFGYCSREYIGALMIIGILMTMWVILMTIVTLVTYIKNLLIAKVVKQNPFHM